MTRAAGSLVGLALLLSGCGGVGVSLTVQSAREAEARVAVERAGPDGAETFQLGTLLPYGRVRSSFRGERGGRLTVYADGKPVAERRIPDDAPDPFEVEVQVD